jgi:hypothetical protein
LIQAAATVRPDLRWVANELNPACAEDLRKVAHATIGDFLALTTPPEPADFFIITNPPYSLAESFIKHGLRIAEKSAWLLRLNFLGGGRNEFHRKHNPGIFILPNRPSFNGWGSDACEYGWFLYGDPAVSGRIFYLDETPTVEIAAWNEKARKMYPEDEPKKKKARKGVLEAAKSPLSSSEIRAVLSGSLTHEQVVARRDQAVTDVLSRIATDACGASAWEQGKVA